MHHGQLDAAAGKRRESSHALGSRSMDQIARLALVGSWVRLEERLHERIERIVRHGDEDRIRLEQLLQL